MNDTKLYILIILVVAVTILAFYSIGQEAIESDEQIKRDSINLSDLPTSTPRPQISRLIREALKRRPRPTPPPNSSH